MAAITDKHNWANTQAHLKVYKVPDRPEYELTAGPSIIKKLTWGDDTLPLYANATEQVFTINLLGDGFPHKLSARSPENLPFLRLQADGRNGLVFLHPVRDW